MNLILGEPSRLETGCWIWPLYTTKDGYGSVKLFDKQYLVHRLVYAIFHGCIPDGMDLHHLCENPPCANPYHLLPVDDRQHAMLGDNTGTRSARKTHCPKGHPYSGDNLYVQPDGGRVCRECRKQTGAAYKARNRALLREKNLARSHRKKQERRDRLEQLRSNLSDS